jgi:hypothetical protein
MNQNEKSALQKLATYMAEGVAEAESIGAPGVNIDIPLFVDAVIDLCKGEAVEIGSLEAQAAYCELHAAALRLKSLFVAQANRNALEELGE